MSTSVITQENTEIKQQPYLLFMMHEIFDDLAEDLDDSVIEKLRDAFHPTSPAERIKAAQSIVNEDQSGFAQLILARNYANTEQKLEHYKKAVEVSKNADDHAASALIFALASIELSELLWSEGKREEAIAVLNETEIEELQVGQYFTDAIRFSLMTYLLCEKQIEKAREILNGESVPTLEWHYANALLKFIEQGDCNYSRGAAAAAFGFDDEMLEHFADTAFNTMFEALEQGDESSAEDIDIEGYFLDRYVRVTGEAWRSTDGALTWLKDWRDDGLARVGEEETIDEARVKRIESELEILGSHLEREDFKEARKSFAKVLRDANRLNDGGAMFEEIIATVARVDEALEGNMVATELEKRAEWLKEQEKTAKPEALANSYADLSVLLSEIPGQEKLIESSAKKALEYLEKNPSRASTHVEQIALSIIGSLAIQNEDWTALESNAKRIAEIVEQTSSSNHLDMIDALQLLRMSLRMQERLDEEKAVAERIYAIDEFADERYEEGDCDDECDHDH